MIPSHHEFIEAIQQKRKVNVRYYSTPDHALLDRVCAPLDYCPCNGPSDGLNRYWLWDYANNTGTPLLGLVPQQIVDVRVLGEGFDPADFAVGTAPWSIPRNWGCPPVSSPVR